jgi:hypothetical protein
MAHMSQEKKKTISLALKPILAKYKVKATLSVHNYSTINVTILESHLDFIGNYEEVLKNDYYRMNQQSNKSVGGEVVFDFKNLEISHSFQAEHFSGICAAFLKELHTAINLGNHDRSDSQSDYFDVGWYSSIRIGRWDTPYKLIQEAAKEEQIKTAPQVFDNVVEIVDYSEKAIAVFGDTKPMKDKLKALGGRFNPFLNNNGEKMAGWIFSKTKSIELYQLLNAAA